MEEYQNQKVQQNFDLPAQKKEKLKALLYHFNPNPIGGAI